VRLGLSGDVHKQTRKILSRSLTGSSAFATAASEERWKEKHGRKPASEE